MGGITHAQYIILRSAADRPDGLVRFAAAHFRTNRVLIEHGKIPVAVTENAAVRADLERRKLLERTDDPAQCRITAAGRELVEKRRRKT